ISDISGKGRGMIAGRDFEAGDFVCEYIGEVVSSEEYQHRIQSHSMMEIDDRLESHWYVLEVKNGVYLDSTYMGNLSRFINHSCSPNARNKVVNVKGTYRMGIFCIKDIKRGEEIFYDYGFKSKGIGGGFRCLCGSANCRGQIGISTSHSNVFKNIEKLQKYRMEGNTVELLDEFTAHMTNNDFSDPYRLKRPHPAAVLDDITTVNDWILQKRRKFSSFESKNPFWAGIVEQQHLFNAHPNFLKLLHLNGGTLKDYMAATSKKFAMDVPWTVFANELSWPQRDAARECGVFYDEFFFSARRFYQCQMLVLSRLLHERKDSDNLQSIMDKSWGKREVCTVCGKYGEMNVCEACGEVIHQRCIDVTCGKDEEFLCLVCRHTGHRNHWYLTPEFDREIMAMNLSHFRTFTDFSLISNRHSNSIHEMNLSEDFSRNHNFSENLFNSHHLNSFNFSVGWEDWSM
ncbi:histone lysine methyltransferase SET2, partial [Cardiosporidium cionae]